MTPNEALQVALTHFDLLRMLALMVLPCVFVGALAVAAAAWEGLE